MDGYFARLAQRSDVAPATAAPRTPGTHSAQHTRGDSLEQEIEVTVPRVDVTAPPIAAADPTSLAIDTETSGPVSPSRSSDPAPVAKPDPTPTTTTAVPFEPQVSGRTGLLDDSMQRPHAAAAPSARDVPAADRATADARFTATAAPRASEQALPSTPTATGNASVPPPTAPLHAPTTPTVAASAPPHDAWTADDVAAASAQSITRAEPPASVHSERATRAEPDPHGSAATPTTAVSAHVRPRSLAQTPESRAGAQQTRAAPQVHIGRIELEVRNSAPTPPALAPMPTPAAIAPAPPRSAAFNPHRHYLRGV